MDDIVKFRKLLLLSPKTKTDKNRISFPILHQKSKKAKNGQHGLSRGLPQGVWFE